MSRRATTGTLLMARLALILLLSFTFTASAQGVEAPMEAVRATVTEILRILNDETLKDQTKHAQRRRMLEDVAANRFDYAEMSKRVLGSQWKPLTDAQRKEFVAAYKSFLSDKYAGRIEDYTGHKQDVRYLSERTEGAYAEVRTELRSDKTTIPMDYRLSSKDGRWFAYDIIIDGVSLVSNYRSQFQKIIRDSSYEGLVNTLRERTLSAESKSK